VPISLDRTVAGLHDGMVGMRVGGVRKIVIPSALGYGNQPRSSIPPNSTLVFDIRLVTIAG
jgi:FKBP-type peptidyl-prolyl cis-trans isomerase